MPQEFNVSEWTKLFDPSAWMNGAKMPTLNTELWTNVMLKNMDALAQSNRTAYEGLQAIAQRQAEIFSQTLTQANDGIKSVMKAKSPEENAATQAELAKQAVEQSLANAREILDLAAKSSEAAIDPLRARFLAGFEEIKQAVAQAPKASVETKVKAAAE